MPSYAVKLPLIWRPSSPVWPCREVITMLRMVTRKESTITTWFLNSCFFLFSFLMLPLPSQMRRHMLTTCRLGEYVSVIALMVIKSFKHFIYKIN